MGIERIHIKELKLLPERLKVIIIFILVIFGILFLRLLYLQVFRTKHFGELATYNSIRIVPKRAFRGIIYDRAGIPLVENMSSYTVSIIPADLTDKNNTLNKLSSILKINISDIEAKLEKGKYHQFEPLKIVDSIDVRVASILDESKFELPGIVIGLDSRRNYPNAEIASHILGYIGEVNELQVLDGDGKYSLGDTIGQTGVEKKYDDILRGKNGQIKIIVNALGRQVGILEEKNREAGSNITLTIDSELQKVAEEAMSKKTGAVIVMNPKNGEILSYVSKPGFDPNLFSARTSSVEWKKIMSNRERPMFNRGIKGLYAPGSIFKLITAIAALESDICDEHTKMTCKGKYVYNTWEFKCWKKEGHGTIDLNDAIKDSCDVYLYQLGLKTRVERIAKYAKLFGFGSPTGVVLGSEEQGLVPTPEWKEFTTGVFWFPGDTMHMAIGQGYLLVTPIQILQMINVIANSGIAYAPHIIEEKESKPCINIPISKNTFDIIKKAMLSVVENGTGYSARIPGVNIAGKTSSIQNPHGADHAAFVAFGPVEDPQISVIAFVEKGGKGSAVAAPIARQILEKYFSKQKKENYAVTKKP